MLTNCDITDIIHKTEIYLTLDEIDNEYSIDYSTWLLNI